MTTSRKKRVLSLGLWLDLAAITVVCGFFYVLMEWLFFVTKPSFLSTLNLTQKLRIVPLASAPLLLLGLAVTSFFALLSLISQSARWKRLCRRMAIFWPALLLATIFYLLADNFSYTVFGVGTLTLQGKERILAVLVFLGLAASSLIWLQRLAERPPADADGQGGKRILRRARLSVALAIVAGVLLALVTEMPSGLQATARSEGEGQTRRPNIILVGGDGLNAEKTSLYGYSRETTPRLTEFAREAILFENAFSNSGHTASSLMSILTGKLPTTTRLIYPPDILKGEHSHQHLPGLLRQLGYQNSMVSLRHFGDPYDLNLRGGFHFSNARTEGNSPIQTAAWIGWSAAYFNEVLVDRVISRVGSLLGYETLTDAYQEVTRPTDRSKPRDLRRMEMFQEQLESLGRPFFAHLHLMGTHGPRFIPRQQVFSRGQEQDKNWLDDFYDDAILDFDRYFGQLLDFLQAKGLLDRSLIVVYSDHGSGFQTFKRVPLLIRLPGGRPGRVSANVQNVDIAPTILDYLGIGVPAWMDGRSLLGSALPPHRPVFSVRTRAARLFREGGKLQLNPIDLSPPFYGMEWLAMVDCDRWFQLALRSWTIGQRTVPGHTAPCAEKLPAAAARQRLIGHLQSTGYLEDTSGFEADLPDPSSETELVRVLDWGPQQTPKGSAFNVQPDGSSALWIQVEGDRDGLDVILGDRRLPTTVYPEVVTALIEPGYAADLTGRAGAHSLRLARTGEEKMQFVGFLVITDRAKVEEPAEKAEENVFHPDRFDDASLRDVSDWGPRTTDASDRLFNVQPDGKSAFWIEALGDSSDLSVYLEMRELVSSVQPDFITAAIAPSDLPAEPWVQRLFLVDRTQRAKQLIGEFRILPSFDIDADDLAEGRLGEVADWGPRSALEGRAFNPQPDGSSAFWFRVDEESPDLTVLLDGRPLPTTLKPGFITAKVEPSLIPAPGPHELALASASSELKQRVGEFLVFPLLKLEPAELPDQQICQVVDWGPRSVTARRPFHEQPDGRSTFWIRWQGESCAGAAFLGAFQLEVAAGPGLLSALAPRGLEQLESPGVHTLFLVDPRGGGKQELGQLEVRRNWWSWLGQEDEP